MPIKKNTLKLHWKRFIAKCVKNQVQASLWVSGRKWWDFMSYYPEMKPFIVRVFPDKELHLKYEERLRESILLIKNKIEIYKNYSFLK